VLDLREKLKNLPDEPGVYLMKNSKNQIIYVGKAKNLKNRVRQYFFDSANHSPKVQKMVENIADFDYIMTDNELEAFILECNLIKKYLPFYNILLKDDKNYPYIKITNEEYPKILITRRLQDDKARYFGPYTSTFLLRQTLDMVKKLFKLPSCKKNFEFGKKVSRPCLYYHMGQCSAPCQGNIPPEEMKKAFDEAANFLSGNHEKLIKKLTEEMYEASEKLEFERAADIRNKIEGINQIAQKQKVLSDDKIDVDVIALARDEDLAVFEVFYIREGKLIEKEHYTIDGVFDKDETMLMGDFVSQFYFKNTFIPHKVILSHNVDDIEFLAEILREKKGKKVEVRVPKLGEYRALCDMALKNANHTLGEERIKKLSELLKSNAADELAKALGIDRKLTRIEAYDISNTQGAENVGCMVVFVNGKPKKSEYRKFKIKYVVGANDYDSIREVIFRRFNRMLENDEKFMEMPDLILIDGGKGQLSAAKEVLASLNLNIPAFGMVKDDKHKTRGITSQEGEIHFNKAGAAFRLVAQIQDEVHRFSIEYHKTLRGKRNLESVLESIKGVGKVKLKNLMAHFKTINNIKEASMEDIFKVKGMDKKTAQNIYDYFHNGGDETKN